jgi:hypothetical protein
VPGFVFRCLAAIVVAAWQRRAYSESLGTAWPSSIVRYSTLIERFSVGLGVTPAPLNVITTFWSTPTGVPGFVGPLPPPPPPHEAIAANDAIARIVHAMLQRLRLTTPLRADRISVHSEQASARIHPTLDQSNFAGRSRHRCHRRLPGNSAAHLDRCRSVRRSSCPRR